MLVRDVMTPDAKVIHPNTTVREAATQMESMNVGVLPVGEDDRLVGMITDRDIALRSVAKGENPKTMMVRNAMTEGVHYCFDDQELKDAAQQMKSEKVRRLVVVNRDKRLVGLCSIGDIAVLGDRDIGGDVLSSVSKPVRSPKK